MPLKEMKKRLKASKKDPDRVWWIEDIDWEIYEQHAADNVARSETYEQALALGARIRDAWGGHPHLIPVTETDWNRGGRWRPLSGARSRARSTFSTSPRWVSTPETPAACRRC